MKTTRDEILLTAVRLFAERGFDAVSTSMIAAELGITKGALYRHFENKQQIFDSIIERMFALDAARAEEDHVPAETLDQDPEAYQQTRLTDFCEFVNGQFVFWTEDPFASAFRRMITLEQFKDPRSMKMYQDVIARGPVDYSADLLQSMIDSGALNRDAAEFGARNLAIQLFAPLQLMIQLSDGGEDSEQLKQQLRAVTLAFENRWTASPQ